MAEIIDKPVIVREAAPDNPADEQPKPSPNTGQRQPQKQPQTEPLEPDKDTDIGGGD